MGYGDIDKMKKMLVKVTKKPKKKTQEQIFMKKKMTNSEKFKEHSKHHTKKHIEEMKILIKKGKSFEEAHKLTLKKIGK